MLSVSWVLGVPVAAARGIEIFMCMHLTTAYNCCYKAMACREYVLDLLGTWCG
jgi:predicted outer membrane lipoprotein